MTTHLPVHNKYRVRFTTFGLRLTIFDLRLHYDTTYDIRLTVYGLRFIVSDNLLPILDLPLLHLHFLRFYLRPIPQLRPSPVLPGSFGLHLAPTRLRIHSLVMPTSTKATLTFSRYHNLLLSPRCYRLARYPAPSVPNSTFYFITYSAISLVS